MYLQGMLASIAVGSDLYMILTGFLCCNKTFGKKFYLGGVKVLLSYVFFSLLTIAVNIYLFHTGMTWRSGIMGIFSFSTIPYAWYIEMWIGLFLLAPFLNLWYKSLPSPRMKIYLILLLMSLSVFPDFFNRYGFYVMPKYWENVYPLGFYFTGCFIREYQPRLSRVMLLTLILLITMISSTVTLIAGHSTFLHFIGDRNGIFLATIAVSIFLIFYNAHINQPALKGVFKAISLRSLDIFLCSAVLDYYIYPLFEDRYYIDQPRYGLFYFIIVPLIFVICFCIASVKRWIFSLFQSVLNIFSVDIALQSRG